MNTPWFSYQFINNAVMHSQQEVVNDSVRYYALKSGTQRTTKSALKCMMKFENVHK